MMLRRNLAEAASSWEADLDQGLSAAVEVLKDTAKDIGLLMLCEIDRCMDRPHAMDSSR
jgi:hypothetical protein